MGGEEAWWHRGIEASRREKEQDSAHAAPRPAARQPFTREGARRRGADRSAARPSARRSGVRVVEASQRPCPTACPIAPTPTWTEARERDASLPGTGRLPRKSLGLRWLPLLESDAVAELLQSLN